MAIGKKILYFINDGTPTEADRMAALKVGTLMFRNALAATGFDYVESCDGVAGAVPEQYLKRFPRVDTPEPPKAAIPSPTIVVPPVVSVPTPVPAPVGVIPPWGTKKE